MKKEPVFSTHIITAKDPKPAAQLATGWGDDAVETRLEGLALKVIICKDNHPQFAISFNETGRLIITGYTTRFETCLPNNLELEPTHPLVAK